MQEAYIITSAGYVEVCDGSLAAATGATRIPMSEAGGVLTWLFCRNHATAAAGHPPALDPLSSLRCALGRGRCSDAAPPPLPLLCPTPLPNKIKYRRAI